MKSAEFDSATVALFGNSDPNNPLGGGQSSIVEYPQMQQQQLQLLELLPRIIWLL